MKIIAFYLPQFHAIPENDEWWGKGFTDWTNVKKGIRYVKGQEQPRVPLNDNYYDLSKLETLKWQADLMNEYGLYGMCFYHYWFHGKLLLQKPAEMLLANKDVKMRFCFSWANEPWARTWDGKNQSILIQQNYGKEKEWIDHFEYLLPFFKDSRYIKEGGCPMFLIYKSSSIKDCEKMMVLWDELAKNAGFNGMHFVETLRGNMPETRDLPYKAKVEFEPARTNYTYSKFELNLNRIRRRIVNIVNHIFGTSFLLNKPQQFKKIATRSLSLLSPVGTYGGVFVGWDNTARRGVYATIILPPTASEFNEYLKEKARITQDIYKTNYLFINAWNEWAEGTYLEPDTIHKYDYLNAIKEFSCMKK